VSCTWETEDAFGSLVESDGKRGGGKGSTTASQWRDLAESDMQQYLANSSSEDEGGGSESGSDEGVSGDDSEGSESESDGSDKRGRKAKKPKKKLSKK
jgi:hypothetical protein